MLFVQEKFPENPRMVPEKYGMYDTLIRMFLEIKCANATQHFGW